MREVFHVSGSLSPGGDRQLPIAKILVVQVLGIPILNKQSKKWFLGRNF
jgi:hypothetical protein